MRELEHQQLADGTEKEQQTPKKPIPAKQTIVKPKKENDEMKIDLLEKRQSVLHNNNNINRTFIEPQPDETIAYRPRDKEQRRKKQAITCWRCGQLGHIAMGCQVRLDNCREINRAITYQQQHSMPPYASEPSGSYGNKEDRICGPANKVSITINGIRTEALLDTGSTVSTISQSFYKTHFPSIPIEPLTRILKIECADGQPMPYFGYIDADLQLHGISSINSVYPGIFLIIPDSDYNETVPVLIGTNIMSGIMEDTERTIGPRYLQEAKLHTAWYMAFRCISLRNKELERRNNKLAVIKSAETYCITIPANSQVVINGYMDKTLQKQKMCAILQLTLNSALLDDLDIVTVVVTYDHQHRGNIPVHLSNVTTRTFTVPPRALLCELHPVNIEDMVIPEDKEFKDIMNDIKLPTET